MGVQPPSPREIHMGGVGEKHQKPSRDHGIYLIFGETSYAQPYLSPSRETGDDTRTGTISLQGLPHFRVHSKNRAHILRNQMKKTCNKYRALRATLPVYPHENSEKSQFRNPSGTTLNRFQARRNSALPKHNLGDGGWDYNGEDVIQESQARCYAPLFSRQLPGEDIVET